MASVMNLPPPYLAHLPLYCLFAMLNIDSQCYSEDASISYYVSHNLEM